MILLLLLMVSAIAVPAVIEAVRSPEDNLAHDTRAEVDEAFIQPVRRRIHRAKDDFVDQFADAWGTALPDAVKTAIGDFSTGDVWKLVLVVLRLILRLIVRSVHSLFR